VRLEHHAAAHVERHSAALTLGFSRSRLFLLSVGWRGCGWSSSQPRHVVSLVGVGYCSYEGTTGKWIEPCDPQDRWCRT
jgi:hypothetical protein